MGRSQIPKQTTSRENRLTKAGNTLVFPHVISGCTFVKSDQFSTVRK